MSRRKDMLYDTAWQVLPLNYAIRKPMSFAQCVEPHLVTSVDNFQLNGGESYGEICYCYVFLAQYLYSEWLVCIYIISGMFMHSVDNYEG